MPVLGSEILTGARMESSYMDDYSMSLSLQITNGIGVWKGLISIGDKPASRELDTSHDYFNTLKAAITSTNYQSYEYTFISKGDKLQFLVKERLDGMSALLVKCTLNASVSEAADLRGILGSLCLVYKLKSRAIDNHKKEILDARQTLDTLTAEVGAIRADRDNFMSSFLTKFCLLLNSKKNEIRRLLAEISRLRNAMPSPQPDDMSHTSSFATHGDFSEEDDKVAEDDPAPQLPAHVTGENHISCTTERKKSRTTRSQRKGPDASMSQLLAARGVEVHHSQELDTHLTQTSQTTDGGGRTLRGRQKRSTVAVSESAASLAKPTGHRGKRRRTATPTHPEPSQESEEWDMSDSGEVIDGLSSSLSAVTSYPVSDDVPCQPSRDLLKKGRRKKQIFDASSSEEEAEPRLTVGSMTRHQYKPNQNPEDDDIMNFL